MRIGEVTLFVLCVLIFGGQFSCTHDPWFPEDIIPIDTMTVDTMVIDTIEPCDSTLIYFNEQILPILKGNCAFSGCHDASSAEKDIILIDYNSMIQSDIVEPFNLSGSDLFEAITESDPDKIMPPPPRNKLTLEQINLISIWILQGAKNEECEEGNSCDTTVVSYSQDIVSIINLSCRTCHSQPNPNAGIDLTNYGGVKEQVVSGAFFSAVNHTGEFTPMPFNGQKLSDCSLQKINKWINEGAQNN